jgi:hypothetical protein
MIFVLVVRVVVRDHTTINSHPHYTYFLLNKKKN